MEAIEVSEEPGESLHSKTSRPGILRIGVIAAGLVAVAIAVLVVGRFWLTPPAARPKAGADSAVIEQDTHADAAFVRLLDELQEDLVREDSGTPGDLVNFCVLAERQGH